jgi:ABC-type polysaccharide/polyol phosphate export permease
MIDLSRFKYLSIAIDLARYSSRRKKSGKILGALWSLLEPLILFIILLCLRGKVGGGKVECYPVYLFIGLVGFQFFTQGSRRIMVCLRSHARYARTFPLRLDTYIYATYFETLFDFSYQLAILGGLLVWQGVPLWTLLPFTLFFLLLALFTLGAGYALSVINIYFRDMEVIWGLICRILFFATPIFYVARLKSIFVQFNPLGGYLHLMRDAVISQSINWLHLGIMVLWTLGALIIGFMFFSRLSRRVVEAI